MLLIGKKQKHLKSKIGFTLVELLIVVIILGVLAGLAVPSLRKTYVNLELNNTANNLVYLIRFAQASAVAERSNFRLSFDEQNKSCWLEQESVAGSFEKLASSRVKKIVFSRDISVESEARVINFLPKGKIDNVKIYLKHKNGRVFTVSTEGQIGYVEVFDFKE